MSDFWLAIIILLITIFLAVKYDETQCANEVRKPKMNFLQQVEYIINNLMDFAIQQGSNYVDIHLIHGNGRNVGRITQEELEQFLRKDVEWKITGNWLHLEWHGR